MNLFLYILRYCYGFIKARPKFYHHVSSCGINTEESRSPKFIVSLTSFPVRMKIVSYTIETLLSQTFKPDSVVLWLAEEQFPNGEYNLPKRLLRLKKYGLTICWCNDIRSYKKLVHSLISFPEDILITADDDVYYPPCWLERLVNSYMLDKKSIHCHRGNIIKCDEMGSPMPYNSWGLSFLNDSMKGFNILMTGVGGVLYPPHLLYKDVVREDIFMSIAKDADDLWFWAMAILAGTQIKVVKNNLNDFLPIYMVGNQFLWTTNRVGGNDIVLSNLLSVYPEIRKLLNKHN